MLIPAVYGRNLTVALGADHGQQPGHEALGDQRPQQQDADRRRAVADEQPEPVAEQRQADGEDDDADERRQRTVLVERLRPVGDRRARPATRRRRSPS